MPDLSMTKEHERLELQNNLDGFKTPLERNIMGQFATPTALAQDILKYAKHLVSNDTSVSFLDPAFGTGSFYSTLLSVFSSEQVVSANAVELDPHYAIPAIDLWTDTPLRLQIGDFTKATADGQHSLVICNPPYIRHHHIGDEDKSRLRNATWEASGMKLSGLAGMYCHFLGLAHPWMQDGAIAAWLIPSEFMDVNYGSEVKKYLTEKVNLLHIHRFDPHDAQFDDAIVSSCVVWFCNQTPDDKLVHMSFGGTLRSPRDSVHLLKSGLKSLKKWTQATKPSPNVSADHSTIGDWFRIRRGIATGDNSFFVVSEGDAKSWNLPSRFMRPILPASKHLTSNEILADENGLPLLPERLYLLDCDLPESRVEVEFPDLWRYLQYGIEKGIKEGYLISRRKPWYSQEKRPACPLICNYMGRPTKTRTTPFRFIRNHSVATAANVYLLFEPKPELKLLLREEPGMLDQIWQSLNNLSGNELMSYGRTYGGGLHKLEPKELMAVTLPNLPRRKSLVQSEMLFSAD